MEKYLEPPQHGTLEDKKFVRDGSTMLDQSSQVQGSPYGLNPSVFLPDVTYLRTGLCRPVTPAIAQIKSEPVDSVLYPSCSPSSLASAGHHHPDYTSLFSPTSDAGGNNNNNNSSVFVKQEPVAPSLDFHDIPLFQLLNSELDTFAPASTLCADPHSSLSSSMSAFGGLHPVDQPMANKALCGTIHSRGYAPSAGHYSQLQQKPGYLPPSPPSSEPGSPDRCKDLLQNLSPPPSYAASMASKLAVTSPSLAGTTMTAPTPAPTQVMPIRYNRRNNPDLDKRRIHHCDIPGEL